MVTKARRTAFILLMTAAFLLTGCTASQSQTSPAHKDNTSAGPASAAAASAKAAAPVTTAKGEEKEVIVLAAASMQETLEEIQELYKDVDPAVTLVYNFDSSGTLKTQIEEGAPCDIFISAAQKQMNELDRGTDDAAGLDLLEPGTRIDLLENKVTLVVPAGNPENITSFDDMAAKLRNGDILMAVGNSDVPVGQYTQKIFEYLGLNEEELARAGKLTYGTNVKEVTTQISEGAAACGIIYATDAFSAGLEVVAEAAPEMCGQVIYPAAILKQAPEMEAARAYLTYLTAGPAMQVFESVGFSPAPAA